jgi:hypothetical protein
MKSNETSNRYKNKAIDRGSKTENKTNPCVEFYLKRNFLLVFSEAISFFSRNNVFLY